MYLVILLEKQRLTGMRHERRWVMSFAVRSFCGTWLYLLLVMACACLYAPSLIWTQFIHYSMYAIGFLA